MGSLVGKARHWWRKAAPAPTIPYEITCKCGQVVRGNRQGQAQVVPCPGCGQSVFVLPRSPYPSLDQAPLSKPVVDRPQYPFPFIPRPWGLPLLAAALTLVGVVLIYALILPYLGKKDLDTGPDPAVGEAIAAHVEAGQKWMAEGSFQLAVQELEAARQLHEQHPQALTVADGRWLKQRYREAALLAGLVRNSLQEVLLQAASVRREEDWAVQFRDNYLGKVVIFDDIVHRDAEGRCSLAVYEVRVGDRLARLELGELKLLQTLPLERPRRLIFGARLAGIAREAPGGWVIRFQPDSGVLLTDEQALAAAAPVPLDDEVHRVLRWQAEWVASAP